ncbi:hypothetical protein GLYMA_08G052150v4 [Glycine max]|nr:hypothetical protein GLYMA_08G052150v4 [Glycine max]KAH1049723.1 hypothetical protein GYH30_020306 [Glycine max]
MLIVIMFKSLILNVHITSHCACLKTAMFCCCQPMKIFKLITYNRRDDS